jgi:hypothetical protein
VNEHHDWTLQVFKLHESNYYLCDSQRDLTPIQLLFLSKGSPIYNKHMEEEQEKQKSNSRTRLNDPSFKERYRKKLREKDI